MFFVFSLMVLHYRNNQRKEKKRIVPAGNPVPGDYVVIVGQYAIIK